MNKPIHRKATIHDLPSMITLLMDDITTATPDPVTPNSLTPLTT